MADDCQTGRDAVVQGVFVLDDDVSILIGKVLLLMSSDDNFYDNFPDKCEATQSITGFHYVKSFLNALKNKKSVNTILSHVHDRVHAIYLFFMVAFPDSPDTDQPSFRVQLKTSFGPTVQRLKDQGGAADQLTITKVCPSAPLALPFSCHRPTPHTTHWAAPLLACAGTFQCPAPDCRGYENCDRPPRQGEGAWSQMP